MLLSSPGLKPTPTDPGMPKRLGDFSTLCEALDYAAQGEAGFNFYSARGQLAATLSYRDLRSQAESLARRLLGAGLARGDRVALLAATAPEFLVLFFACQYGGLIPVPMPLPTAFGRRDAYVAQIKGQLLSSQARMALGPREFLPLVTEAAQGLGLMLVGAHGDIAALPERGTLVPARPQDLSYIQYSSGSTRFPKGVMVAHANLMANCLGMNTFGIRVRSDDRGLSWLPFFHDMGLVGFVMCGVTSQTSVDYLATEDFARRPLTWLKLFSDNAATITYAPSFGYELCARRVSTMAEGALQLDLSRWRLAGIGGEMIKPKVMQAFGTAFKPYGFSEKAFCASYGLAECVLAVSFSGNDAGLKLDHVDKNALEDHRASPIAENAKDCRTFVSCGKVLPEHKVEIRAEDGAVLSGRAVGRIFVQGPSIMLGYLNEDEATAEALAGGWLDTGDLGYWLDDELVIVGRAKDMMIVNGRNVWPQDIEWAVEKAEGLRSGDSAAILLGAGESERPAVLVQCRAAKAEDRQRLAAEVKAKVQEAAGILCEVILVVPRSLPKTSSGKLARARARAMFERGEIASVAPDRNGAPMSDGES
jgi:fatty-acyl-CoA synthase